MFVADTDGALRRCPETKSGKSVSRSTTATVSPFTIHAELALTIVGIIRVTAERKASGRIAVAALAAIAGTGTRVPSSIGLMYELELDEDELLLDELDEGGKPD